jgi:hypothetical protein
MRSHRNSPRSDARENHRYAHWRSIAVAALPVPVTAAILFLLWQTLPYLLVLGTLLALVSRSRPRSRRRRASPGVAELVLALVAARYGLRRQGRSFGPSWHPCEECGHPIDRPSRAHYCSDACRRYARMRRSAGDPELTEVPF